MQWSYYWSRRFKSFSRLIKMLKGFLAQVRKIFQVLFLFGKLLLEVEFVTATDQKELRGKNFRLVIKKDELQVNYEGLLLVNPLFLAFCTEEDDEELSGYREVLATEDEELRAQLLAKLAEEEQCSELAECGER